MPAVGLLHGRFEVLALAGEGATSRVYRAVDQETGAIVALKVLHEGGDLARLEREMAALASLDHPAIVHHVADGRAERQPWLAMQWLEGEDLRARLARGPLGVAEVTAIALRIGSALAHIHARGFVHRDVKPSNIVVVGGALENATLVDFGLAHAPATDAPDSGLGTPGYMAPEQIVGDHAGPELDVFALGCSIYKCLTGAGPFHAKGITAVLARILHEAPGPLAQVADVPQVLGDLVDAMLQKPRAQRPSLDEVLAVFGRLRAMSAPPPARRATGISAQELHLVSVLVAGVADVYDDDTTLRRAPASPDMDLAKLQAVAARFEANLSLLPNGSLVAILAAKGAATDLAVRAAQCALALELRLRDVAITVATGRAELGRALVGDAIDLATAMLAHAPPNAITVDEVTAGLLGERFDVQGSTLLAERSAIDAPRTLLGRKTTSVGRATDLGELVDWFEASVESGLRVALVLGAAGIGKSRLRHELTSEVQGQADVWIARADPVRAASPFALLAPMLRDELGVARGQPAAARWERVIAAVEESARGTLTTDDVVRIATFLGEMVSAGPPDADANTNANTALAAARRDPVLHADQTRRAFCDYLRLRLDERPLVLVLEDIHWADVPSIGVITEALRSLARCPLFVVGLARPDVMDRFPNLWLEQGVRMLRLAPLSAWAGMKLVQQLLPDLPEPEVEALVERGCGNPFYLEELIRARAQSEGDSSQLPETVVAMAHARLERLHAGPRLVLRAASIAGMVFTPSVIATLVGDELSAEHLAGVIDALQASEILVRREARGPDGAGAEPVLGFRHALVREAAYAMLTAADRTRGHRLIAQWLQERGEPDALLVAEHFDRGGSPAEAAPLYVVAARAALEANDPEGALERGRAAERCGVAGADLATLRALQAVAHRYHGDFALAVTHGLEALTLLPKDDPDWVEALAAVAVNASAVGAEHAALDRLLEEVRGMFARGISPRGGVAAALSVETFTRAGMGDVATEVLDALVSRSGLLADPICRGTIHYACGFRLLGTSPSEANEWLASSAAAHDEAGNQRGASASRMNMAAVDIVLGQYERAEALFREVRATRVALGSNVVLIDHNLGLVLAYNGKLDEALATEQSALDAARAGGSPMVQGFCRVYLSKIHRVRGELARAEQEARTAVALLEPLPPALASAWGELAIVLLEQKRAPEALEAARAGMAARDRTGPLEEGEVLLRIAHAEALAASGDVAGARAEAQAAKDAALQQATSIRDDAARASFLATPENARALAFTGP